jgi:hypothetical protein
MSNAWAPFLMETILRRARTAREIFIKNYSNFIIIDQYLMKISLAVLALLNIVSIKNGAQAFDIQTV